jgi:hypothetical protein
LFARLAEQVPPQDDSSRPPATGDSSPPATTGEETLTRGQFLASVLFQRDEDAGPTFMDNPAREMSPLEAAHYKLAQARAEVEKLEAQQEREALKERSLG